MIKYILIILMCIALVGCLNEDYPDPPEFSAYVRNPVLSRGDSNQWDNECIVSPYVIWDGDLCYMFYTGFNADGPASIGLAISTDGYHFSKLSVNPVLTPAGKGFDAFSVGGPIVVREDTCWVMYYNSLEISGFGPGPFIGRATSSRPEGPWHRSEQPILTTGSKGEWDSYYIFPTSLIVGEDGTRMLYYSGGNGFDFSSKGAIGLATSTDGKTWKKHNKPKTSGKPYAVSDPVLLPGKEDEWDSDEIWTCNIISKAGGYEAYYSGGKIGSTFEILSIGHAISNDGIHWNKFRDNPMFRVEDDPFSQNKEAGLEGPFVIIHDSLYFMYYDYGTILGSIGLATAPVQ